MREEKVENYLVKQAKKRGLIVRKVKWEGRKGAPDRLILCPMGKSLWVETKTDAWGKVDPIQKREHQRMRAFGQDVRIAWNRGQVDEIMEEVDAWLEILSPVNTKKP